MGRDKPPISTKSNLITKQGEQDLRNELDYLWRQERPKVTQEVSDAAKLGDRSENAEYIYGKKRLREIDRRVRYLTKRLEVLKVINRMPEDKTKIFFGAFVRVENEEGKELCFQIVGPDEISSDGQKISIDSPMARALIGKSTMDEICVVGPHGEKIYTVLAISYT